MSRHEMIPHRYSLDNPSRGLLSFGVKGKWSPCGVVEGNVLNCRETRLETHAVIRSSLPNSPLYKDSSERSPLNFNKLRRLYSKTYVINLPLEHLKLYM